MMMMLLIIQTQDKIQHNTLKYIQKLRWYMNRGEPWRFCDKQTHQYPIQDGQTHLNRLSCNIREWLTIRIWFVQESGCSALVLTPYVPWSTSVQWFQTHHFISMSSVRKLTFPRCVWTQHDAACGGSLSGSRSGSGQTRGDPRDFYTEASETPTSNSRKPRGETLLSSS